MSRPTVTAVVPVKRLTAAKSRLALPEPWRQRLALAFALDAVTALLATPEVGEVLVVTADPLARRRLGEEVRIVADEGGGLGGAIRSGLAVARHWRPGTGSLVVPADLPCLSAHDVTAVLAAAGGAPAFVPDRAGTGTTLSLHPADRPARTRYGADSARLHRALGLLLLDSAPMRARHDVDALPDLLDAALVGVGDATAEVLDDLGLWAGAGTAHAG